MFDLIEYEKTTRKDSFFPLKNKPKKLKLQTLVVLLIIQTAVQASNAHDNAKQTMLNIQAVVQASKAHGQKK